MRKNPHTAMVFLSSAFDSLKWKIRDLKEVREPQATYMLDDSRNSLRYGVSLSWQPDDPLLIPRPALPVYTPILNLMGTKFWEMNQAGQFADFTFTITLKQGEDSKVVKFPISKMVLLPRSEFFNRQFAGPMAPQGNEEEFGLTNDPDLLMDFLYFIYTGELSQNSKSKIANPKYCLALYSLANATETKELQLLCSIELAKALSSESLLQTASAAFECGDQPLLAQCSWFVRTHPNLHEEFDASEDLSIDDLLQFIDLTEAIGAISHPDKVARRHDVDSLQELFCQQLEKVDNADDFLALCKYTVRIGNRLGERNPLYKRLKEVCKVGREQPLNDLIEQNPEVLDAYSDVLLKPRTVQA